MEEFFWKNVQVQMSRLEFLKIFSKTSNFQQQILLIKPFVIDWTLDQIQDLEKTKFSNVAQKNDKISKEHVDEMVKCCREENFKKAEQESNKAIAYASSDNVLAEAFAAKATLYNRLKEMGGAMGELDMAIATHNGRRSSWEKLKMNYQKEVDKEMSVEEKEMKVKWMDEKTKRKEFKEELFVIKSPNPIAPALEGFVSIHFNSSRGRHLIANQHVPIGQTLLIEKPFVSVLNKSLDVEPTHCHNCLERNLGYIPCPKCVFALFCDRKCMEEATIYHKYECPCLPYLKSILYEKNEAQDSFDAVNFQMAFKLICLLGPSTLFQQFQNPHQNPDPLTPPTTTSEFKPKIPGFDPLTGIYDSQSYLTIINLATNFSTEKFQFQLALSSIILTKILKLKTNFFENVDSCQIEKFTDFVAQKILEHYASIRLNVMSIWEFNGRLGRSLEEQMSIDYEVNLFARGLYPTLSLCNHSCDPNVMLFHDTKFGRIAIVSVRPLKKGEEVTIFYCPPFPDQIKSERQQRLSSGYGFDCSCVACLQNWESMTEGLNSLPLKFCCAKCSAQLFHDLKFQEEMNKIVLDDENEFKCSSCQSQYDRKTIQDEFSRHKNEVAVSLRLRLGNSPLEALNGLRLAMEFFDNNIIPPYAFANFIQKFYIEAILHLTK